MRALIREDLGALSDWRYRYCVSISQYSLCALLHVGSLIYLHCKSIHWTAVFLCVHKRVPLQQNFIVDLRVAPDLSFVSIFIECFRAFLPVHCCTPYKDISMAGFMTHGKGLLLIF